MADLSGRILGDYILREKIGDGGYGDVYRAEHRLLKRVAVVKVLNEERQCSDNAEERFLREAQLASQLRHPYAAHIYDFGVSDEDGLLWIAMELVEGVTLGAWLEQHGPMSLEEFVPFFEYVAEVVDAAHAAGIVHRDLKPSNVMVMERKGRLVPKLLDFGIAKGTVAPLVEDDDLVDTSGVDKVVTELIRSTPRRVYRTKTAPIRPMTDPAHERRITRTGAGMGSRPYMAPEQWHNASELRAVLQADPREQIRSLTRQWQEGNRSPDLLARGQVLADLERCVHRVGKGALSDLECAFFVDSQRLDASNGRLLWALQAHKSYVIGVHYEGNDIVTRGFTGDVSRWTLPQPDKIIEACHAITCASAALAEK
jgi:serine/threonine protein kinase